MDRGVIFEASDLKVRLTCTSCDTEFVIAPPVRMTGNRFDNCPQCNAELFEALPDIDGGRKQRLNNLIRELGNLQESDSVRISFEVGWDPS